MAIIRDKKLLALALEWKANPKHANEDKFRYKGIEYDYEKEIFPSARFQFQKYNSAYKDNKSFAEAFARDLIKRNSELIAEINKGAKSAEEQIYYEEQPTTQAGTEAVPAQQAPVGESPTSMAGGISLPSTSLGTSPARRVIRVVTQAPQPKIFVAGKSGAVTEAGDASKLVKASRSGEILESGQPSKLVTANKSGVIQETPSESKLVSANRSGVVKEKPPSQIFTANKSGLVTGVRNIKSPGWLKTFGSNAQIFVKKNLVTGLAGFAGGLGGALASGGSPLAMAGGAFGGVAGKSWLGNGGFAKIGNGLADRVGRLSNLAKTQASTAGKVAQGRTKWVVGALMGFIFLSVAFSAVAPTPQTGQAAPVSGSQPLTTSLASCPVSSNKITWPSYQLIPNTSTPTGHCTTDDEGKCPAACPFTGRRAKSIDVDTSGGKDVVLPTILGQSVQWNFIQHACAGAGTYPKCSAANGGTGGLYAFEGTIKGQTDTWSLQFVHMAVPTQLTLYQTYASATIVGKTDIGIVHVTIGKNIKNPLGSGSSDTDCEPGWISADTGLGMCTGLPPAQTLGNTYWFLLNRQKRYEILYKGTPEKISQSQVVKISTVNPGSPGNEPTPIPQKLGKKFWSLTGEVRLHPQDSDPAGYEKFGPYFIVLDVPFKNEPDPSCNNNGTTDCYGPVPYIECGPNQDQQCNWHTAGEFGIHGNDKLDPPGSAGCVRHSNTDITDIYNTLSSAKAVNSNTRYYVIDSDIDSSGLTDENFAQELNK